MSLILEKINAFPVKQNEKESWYLSPLREENTASFHVTGNLWHDFGDGTGGNSVDFVCHYLKCTQENNTASDALRCINNMTANSKPLLIIPDVVPRNAESERSLVLTKAHAIQEPSLIAYLQKRGISLNYTPKCLKEVHVYNKKTQKSFYALGVKNEENGYELRNPNFKGNIGTKDITFIRGTIPKPDKIHLFEGMFDYLTFLTIMKTRNHTDDMIVLNSLSCLNLAVPYIKNYGPL
ncbi:hypothetical protein BDD43_2158 [Mucilaginibacter gracilis]|uniref:Toprim domain-containing protein n=1 Tax=Mucilaginibacter gracilis TaxID=423350 RepID=A0A495J106_9SPHI|nr:hypothetical protein [Mucilaginibacter gracilis]RKR81994.1 hypothetical protein BDD43_2158 [Mucilaginibacter gracilis]